MYINEIVTVAENCPANHADHDIEISRHDFRFVATDATNQSSIQSLDTEIFGYFQPEGLGEEDWADDIAETDTLAVPINSPISTIAHEVAADATGDKAHVVGEELRRAVAACSCTYADECPALGRLSLLEAIEKAATKQS